LPAHWTLSRSRRLLARCLRVRPVFARASTKTVSQGCALIPKVPRASVAACGHNPSGACYNTVARIR
jgi:hypothetical protein